MKPITLSINVSATLTLNETELRALSALFSYSPEAFLQGAYEKLGTYYIKPHAEGIRSLHETVRAQLSPQVAECDEFRRKLAEALKAKR